MGKEQSKLNPTVTSSVASNKALENAISPKQLAEVQKTILLEYPFLENVYESMLLTDTRLPDGPIVFANDQVRSFCSSFFLFCFLFFFCQVC